MYVYTTLRLSTMPLVLASTFLGPRRTSEGPPVMGVGLRLARRADTSRLRDARGRPEGLFDVSETTYSGTPAILLYLLMNIVGHAPEPHFKLVRVATRRLFALLSCSQIED